MIKRKTATTIMFLSIWKESKIYVSEFNARYFYEWTNRNGRIFFAIILFPMIENKQLIGLSFWCEWEITMDFIFLRFFLFWRMNEIWILCVDHSVACWFCIVYCCCFFESIMFCIPFYTAFLLPKAFIQCCQHSQYNRRSAH